MRRRIRAWFRGGPLGLVVTVGVVLGFATFQVLVATMDSLVIPLLIQWRNPDAGEPGLIFHLGNGTYDYSFFVGDALALVVLTAVVYYIFVAGDLTAEELTDTRDCPECKNEIWADATRCGFCTAVVEPLMPSEQSAIT
jgi:large conductance mechanosensitive channel